MLYAVHQPHYLPYLGYLDKVDRAEMFVFLEHVQFVKREFQNRNKIKTPQGGQWLTVPVKGDYKAAIHEMVPDPSKDWPAKHLEMLRRNYAKAEHLDELGGFAEVIEKEYSSLADLSMATTGFFLERFGITTQVRCMADFEDLPEDPNERIAAIGHTIGGVTYLAGSGGRNYMDLDFFTGEGIKVHFHEFHPNPYPQSHGEFLPYMGAIDLLLNAGPEGFDRYVRSPRKGE